MSQDRRISLIGGLILAALTLTAGFSVFAVMRDQAEGMLSKSLELALQGRVNDLIATIQSGIAKTRLVATRPYLTAELGDVERNGSDPRAHAALAHVVDTFLANGFSAIALYDRSGKLVVSRGQFPAAPLLSVRLHTSTPVWLLQVRGMALRVNMRVGDDARTVGMVSALIKLSRLDAMLRGLHSFVNAGDLALCAPRQADMACFRTMRGSPVFPAVLRYPGGPLSAMRLALEGKRGVTRAVDYRHHQVEAAYSPVNRLGLGMVLDIDTDELYQPVRRQLERIVPVLLILLGTGVLLLRWQVMPLVRKIVASEQEARESNTRLRDSETRIRAIVDSVEEGIVAVDDSGRIETVNPAAGRIFRYAADELPGRELATLIPGATRSPMAGARGIREAAGEGTLDTAHEWTGRRSDGTDFPLEVRVSEMRSGGRRLWIAAVRDITKRKFNEQRITHLASHDPLTDLPNRALLQDRIEQAIAHAHREGHRVAVMFIDLDKFKTINDSLGHAVGDQLLRQVARRIQDELREIDTVARQGGDEFIVVLPGINDAKDAAVTVEKILASLAEPYDMKGHELHTSASAGVTLYPDDGVDVDVLLKNSDTAMYHAKDSGRNTFQFFAPAMNVLAAGRLSLETSLRNALERDEFVLYYQPVVDLRRNRIKSMEALLRWQPAGGEWLLPERFVPVAEDIGLIGAIGEWALSTACRQLRAWQTEGYSIERIAVNLSLRQLRSGDPVACVARVLQDTGLDPSALELEITESALMHNAEEALGILKTFAALGIHLSIDDFGTGYSSLSHLKRFPIDRLKIDMSFIRDVVSDPDDAAIVTAIVAMADRLGIRVTAEGVESAEQVAFLDQRGCDEYQGYYFSRPLVVEQATELLSRTRTGGWSRL